MLYANRFKLTGTDKQQQIVKAALDQIKFPWEKINLPGGTAEIGWDNLNGQIHSMIHARKHEGHAGEPLLGIINGKRYTMGVFYPGIGSIYVDNLLVDYPDEAMTTVSAEIAHSVDEFLPLSDNQRKQIMTLLHTEGKFDHDVSVDTWWEKVDYSTEYFSLDGESFMILFTYAYSDMPFSGANNFVHPGAKDMGPGVRKIIGIERTDVQEPAPAPTPQVQNYFAKEGSVTFHDTHKNKWINLVYFATRDEAIAAGYKPCKVCKP